MLFRSAAIAIASIESDIRSRTGMRKNLSMNCWIKGWSENCMALNASILPRGISFRMAVMFGADSSCFAVTFRRSSAACLRVRPARPGALGSFGTSRLASFEELAFVGADEFFDFFRRGVEGLSESLVFGKRSSNGGVSDMRLRGMFSFKPLKL